MIQLATVDGLEGLSIGNLAAAIGMSKSGLYRRWTKSIIVWTAAGGIRCAVSGSTASWPACSADGP